MMTYDFDFAGGEAEFRKALELDPSDATVYSGLPRLLLSSVGGRRNRSMRPTAPINSICYRRSSARPDRGSLHPPAIRQGD